MEPSLLSEPSSFFFEQFPSFLVPFAVSFPIGFLGGLVPCERRRWLGFFASTLPFPQTGPSSRHLPSSTVHSFPATMSSFLAELPENFSSIFSPSPLIMPFPQVIKVTAPRYGAMLLLFFATSIYPPKLPPPPCPLPFWSRTSLSAGPFPPGASLPHSGDFLPEGAACRFLSFSPFFPLPLDIFPVPR